MKIYIVIKIWLIHSRQHIYKDVPRYRHGNPATEYRCALTRWRWLNGIWNISFLVDRGRSDFLTLNNGLWLLHISVNGMHMFFICRNINCGLSINSKQSYADLISPVRKHSKQFMIPSCRDWMTFNLLLTLWANILSLLVRYSLRQSLNFSHLE